MSLLAYFNFGEGKAKYSYTKEQGGIRKNTALLLPFGTMIKREGKAWGVKVCGMPRRERADMEPGLPTTMGRPGFYLLLPFMLINARQFFLSSK